MEPIDVDARFIVEAAVGSGAFGEVFRAVDRISGQPVAIKRLHAHVAVAHARERFRLEARALSRVSHPNVVGIVGYGVDTQSRPCLVLEWLDGVDLAVRCRRTPPTSVESVEFTRQAALALEALHSVGIVHRDVKPSNFIVIERDGAQPQIKLIDLGIARVVDITRLTATGTVLGTPAYMSPEQARGSDDLTARSDLYSLGVMLYELLTGRRPFMARDLRALLAQILLQDPPAIQQFAPIADDLASIVHTTLAKSPEDRFASGAALANALADVVVPVASRPAPSTDASSRDAPTIATPAHGEPTDIREQRLVTIVFIELPGAGDSRRLLDACCAIAERYGGAFEPMLGRRGLIVFGASKSLGDETMRAATASLRIRRHVAGTRLALVTARVAAISGAVDGEALEQLAEQFDRASVHGVAVDEVSARLLGDAFEIATRDGVHVLLPSGAFARSPRLAGRQLPTVGREPELAWLFDHVARVRESGRSAAVLIKGVPGIGKSRLRAEFIERLASMPDPPRVLLARGDVVRGASPFALLGDLLQDAAAIGAGDTLDTCRAKLRACVAQSLPPEDVDRVSEFLGECIGIPFPDDDRAHLRAAREDPRLMGDHIARALQDWLRGETTNHAAVIAIDGLQWGDAASIGALDASLHALRTQPLLVVGFARPDIDRAYPSLWTDGTRKPATRDLGTLHTEAAERLVRGALDERADAARVSAIVARAAGNAFFLEELVRAELAGQGTSLPLTVHALVQARLDALEARQRTFVRAASVFGSRFVSSAAIGVVSREFSEATARDVATSLLASELLVRTSLEDGDESVLAFAQPLLRDAAYASLDDATRKRYHRLAAQSVERHVGAEPGVLAEHYERCDEAVQALRLYRLAAVQALRGNDFAGVIDYANRGLRLAPARELAGELVLLRAEAARWRGELAASTRDAADALDRLTPHRAPWYRALTECTRLGGMVGDNDVLARMAALLQAGEPAPEAVRAAAFAFHFVATQFRARALWTEVLALIDRMDRIIGANASGDPTLEALLAHGRAARARHVGNPGLAVVEQENAAGLWESAGDLREATVVGSSVGYGYAVLGAFARAESILRRTLTQADRLGMRRMVSSIKHNLGFAIARLGDTAGGLALEREALAGARVYSDRRLECAAQAYVALIHNLRGEFVEAERAARDALGVTGVGPDVAAMGRAELSVALLGQRRTAPALLAAQDAVRAVEAHGAHDEEVYIRVVLARALGAAGDLRASQEMLRIARAQLSMKAGRITDPALRNGYTRAIPEHVLAWEHGGSVPAAK